MSRQPLLLDTNAAIFLAHGETLTPGAEEILIDAEDTGRPVLLSPITAWELGLLVSRGRLALAQPPLAWFQGLLDRGIDLAPMPPEVLIASSFLLNSPLRDPADRIIAATARTFGYTVVTRDRLLLDYAAAGHLKALAC
ncbi:type II toxin-antitoxin system VapC family toxin [soil metagenome]